MSGLLAVGRDAGAGPCSAYDRQTLREQLLSLSVAGHDSTAASLAWALDFLLRDEDARSWIRDDCASIAHAPSVGASILSSAGKLESVIRESMRLRPVAPFVNRRTNKPITLGTCELPAGTVVCPCMVLCHRHADVGSNPNAFQKDRFYNGAKPQRGTAFPFGGGTRHCIGETLGITELKVILATVLTELDLELIDPRPRIGRRGFVLAPSNDLRARARRAAR